MRRFFAVLALAVVLPAGVVLPSASRADVVVKPGETLSEIAERNGVSLTRLMQANGISDPAFVEAGRRLVIPGTRSTAAAARPVPAAGGSTTVKPGETLSEIADRNGVSLTRLMQANGISDPAFVEAGRRLVIPGTRSTAAAARPAPAAGGSTTVKPGETLSEIADRHGTTVERLMQLNGISNPNLVATGTRLTLPGQPRRSVAQSANARHHVVQSGETLSHIADAYDMPVERLIALNRISDPNLVVAGTRLAIKAPPAVAKPRPVAQKPRPAAGPVAAKPAAKPTPKAVAVASQQAADRPVASKQVASKPEGVKPADTQPALAAAAASATTSSQTVAAKPVDSTAAEAKKTEPKSTELTAAKSSAAESRPVDTRPADQKPLAAQPVSSRPIAAAMATSQPAARTSPAVSSKPVSSKPVSSKPAGGKAGPDWRTYGPMQIDWANWRSMGGSLVAPSLGSDGKPHYLAVNCGARKINATSQSGQWKTWDNPQSDEEQRLVSDLCTRRGG
jgi:LysM repeat protein